MAGEFENRSGTLSEQTALEKDLIAPVEEGGRSGELSEKTSLGQPRSAEQLDQLIERHQKMIEGMLASGENADPKELEQIRDSLRDLLKERKSLSDTRKL